MTTAWCLREEPNVALHMPKLPPSFLTPGRSLLSSFSGTRSLAQEEYAFWYIGQKAVFPETGLAGPEVSAVAVSVLGGSEQAVIMRTAIAITPLRQIRF